MVAFFAEREGFEPPVPLSTPVFKTGVIDHSTISPNTLFKWLLVKSAAKVQQKIKNQKLKIKKYLILPVFYCQSGLEGDLWQSR